jgi:hypothetical protein
VAAGLALAVAVGVRVAMSGLLAGHVTMPATVADLPRITTGADAQAAEDLKKQMEDDNVRGVDAAAYGNDGSATYFAVGAPGEEDEATFVSDFRQGFEQGSGSVTLGEQTPQQANGLDFTCADILAAGQAQGAVCLWTQDTTGAVVSLSPGMEEAAQFSAEVRAQL